MQILRLRRAHCAKDDFEEGLEALDDCDIEDLEDGGVTLEEKSDLEGGGEAKE